MSWDWLSKHRRADAFYAPPLSPIDDTTHTETRHIGAQASALLEWQATEQFELAATFVTFEPGSALRDAGGRSGAFVAAWIVWSF